MKRIIYLFLGVLSSCAHGQGVAYTNHVRTGAADAGNVAVTGDMGANVNQTFRAAGGTVGHPVESALALIPPGTYRYSTPIQIPSSTASPYVTAPILDCQGATLIYTGVGDAVIVHGANALGPGVTGGIRNCNLTSQDVHGMAGVRSIIHIKGRLGFTLDNLSLSNAAACVDWENTNSDGGPGYSEENAFSRINSAGCMAHIKAHREAGGTSSFEYNTITDWHFQLTNGEDGLLLAKGVGEIDTQGLVADLKMNTYGGAGGAATSLVHVQSGNNMIRGNINLRGENGGITAYSVRVDAGGAFYNVGNNLVSNASTSIDSTSGYTVYGVHPPMQTVHTDISPNGENTVHVEPESSAGVGGAPARICKHDMGTNVRFWLANYGGLESDCEFQILRRATDNVNTNVYRKGSGKPIQNVFYTNSFGNIGVGPGFGSTAATGTRQPVNTLEVNGSFAANSAIVGSLVTTAAAPASSRAACSAGQSWDAVTSGQAYHYYCIASGNIVRVAMGTF